MQLKFPVRDGVECMVGWDDPMGTFFAQVYTVDEEGERTDDELLFWVGTRRDEIRTVDSLKSLLKPHATLPEEVYQELFAVEVD